MAHKFAELTFTPHVKALQEADGSRKSYERLEAGPADHNRLGASERAFIGARDSLYMATVGESGWPYLQHRGGVPGFIRVLDDSTLGFLDYRGNRQHITAGNLVTENRVAMFMMDYPNRRRLKILGRARLVTDEESDLLGRLEVQPVRAPAERGFVITVEAFDWNCPQHITPRYTAAEIEALTAPLYARIAELEAALAGA